MTLLSDLCVVCWSRQCECWNYIIFMYVLGINTLKIVINCWNYMNYVVFEVYHFMLILFFAFKDIYDIFRPMLIVSVITGHLCTNALVQWPLSPSLIWPHPVFIHKLAPKRKDVSAFTSTVQCHLLLTIHLSTVCYFLKFLVLSFVWFCLSK